MSVLLTTSQLTFAQGPGCLPCQAHGLRSSTAWPSPFSASPNGAASAGGGRCSLRGEPGTAGRALLPSLPGPSGRRCLRDREAGAAAGLAGLLQPHLCPAWHAGDGLQERGGSRQLLSTAPQMPVPTCVEVCRGLSSWGSSSWGDGSPPILFPWVSLPLRGRLRTVLGAPPPSLEILGASGGPAPQFLPLWLPRQLKPLTKEPSHYIPCLQAGGPPSHHLCLAHRPCRFSGSPRPACPGPSEGLSVCLPGSVPPCADSARQVGEHPP